MHSGDPNKRNRKDYPKDRKHNWAALSAAVIATAIGHDANANKPRIIIAQDRHASVNLLSRPFPILRMNSIVGG
jgi:hypothetical protein